MRIRLTLHKKRKATTRPSPLPNSRWVITDVSARSLPLCNERGSGRRGLDGSHPIALYFAMLATAAIAGLNSEQFTDLAARCLSY